MTMCQLLVVVGKFDVSDGGFQENRYSLWNSKNQNPRVIRSPCK